MNLILKLALADQDGMTQTDLETGANGTCGGTGCRPKGAA